MSICFDIAANKVRKTQIIIIEGPHKHSLTCLHSNDGDGHSCLTQAKISLTVSSHHSS